MSQSSSFARATSAVRPRNQFMRWHLVVGGDYGEEEAVFGGWCGGDPEFARLRVRTRSLKRPRRLWWGWGGCRVVASRVRYDWRGATRDVFAAEGAGEFAAG